MNLDTPGLCSIWKKCNTVRCSQGNKLLILKDPQYTYYLRALYIYITHNIFVHCKTNLQYKTIINISARC